MNYFVAIRDKKNKIYLNIAKLKNLSDSERLFLIYLTNYINMSYNQSKMEYTTSITYSKINKELGWGDHKTARVIKSLRTKQYIHTEKAGRKQRYYTTAKIDSNQDVTSVNSDSNQNQTTVEIDSNQDVTSVNSDSNQDVTSVNSDSNQNQTTVEIDSNTTVEIDSNTTVNSDSDCTQSEPLQQNDSSDPNLLLNLRTNLLKKSLLTEVPKKSTVRSTCTKNLSDDKLRPILNKIFYLYKTNNVPLWEAIIEYISESIDLPFLDGIIKQQIPQAEEKVYYKISKLIFFVFIYKQEKKNNPRVYIQNGIISKYLNNILDTYGKEYVYFNDKFTLLLKSINKDYENRTSITSLQQYYKQMNSTKQKEIKQESEKEAQSLYNKYGKDYTTQDTVFKKWAKELVINSIKNQKIKRETLNEFNKQEY